MQGKGKQGTADPARGTTAERGSIYVTPAHYDMKGRMHDCCMHIGSDDLMGYRDQRKVGI